MYMITCKILINNEAYINIKLLKVGMLFFKNGHKYKKSSGGDLSLLSPPHNYATDCRLGTPPSIIIYL